MTSASSRVPPPSAQRNAGPIIPIAARQPQSLSGITQVAIIALSALVAGAAAAGTTFALGIVITQCIATGVIVVVGTLALGIFIATCVDICRTRSLPVAPPVVPQPRAQRQQQQQQQPRVPLAVAAASLPAAGASSSSSSSAAAASGGSSKWAMSRLSSAPEDVTAAHLATATTLPLQPRSPRLAPGANSESPDSTPPSHGPSPLVGLGGAPVAIPGASPDSQQRALLPPAAMPLPLRGRTRSIQAAPAVGGAEEESDEIQAERAAAASLSGIGNLERSLPRRASSGAELPPLFSLPAASSSSPTPAQQPHLPPPAGPPPLHLPVPAILVVVTPPTPPRLI